MPPRPLSVLVACLALALCAAPLHADIVYQTGFENPPFTPGPINGQDGWSISGTIQSDSVYAGTQALRIDASGTQQAAKRLPGYAVTGRVLDFTMYFLRTGDTSPQAGLALSGDTGFIAQLISKSGGQYYLGNSNSSTPQISFPEGVWHKLELKVDFIALTMEGWVDGTSVGTLPINNTTPPSAITIVQIAAGGTGGPASDVYVDDFTMLDATAPIYSTGFENPPFTLGSISGQDGWSINGTIQSDSVYAGAQALRLDASGPSRNAKRLQGYTATGEVIDFTMYFLRTGDTSPAAGLSLGGDTGFIAQLNSTGGKYYLGNLNSNTPLMAFSEGVWHKLVLRVDFVALTMEGWVDGTSLGTLPIDNNPAPSTITIVQIFTGGTGGTASDVYADNFTMTNVAVPVSVPGRSAVSAGVKLGPARPNPFENGVAFTVDLPRPGQVTLAIYDVRGRVMTRLADGSLQAGRHTFRWDGRDGARRLLPDGVYFAQLRGEGAQLTRKIIFMR